MNRRFTRLAWAAAISTYLLIIFGAIVRITGSGLGCGEHWPLCNGSLLPPLDLPTMIEYGHRLIAAALSVLVVCLAAYAWVLRRADGRADGRIGGLADRSGALSRTAEPPNRPSARPSALNHRAYAASTRTRTVSAAAMSRCPYSIIVGRSSGGSRLPLHSGQCSPQPSPEPVMRTIAPKMMRRYVEIAAAQASRVKRLFMRRECN